MLRLPRLSPRALVALGHDVVMSGLSLWAALYLRLGGDFSAYPPGFVTFHMALFAGISGAVLLLLGSYKGVWRYASLNDLLTITRAATVTVLTYAAVSFLLTRLEGYPRSSLLINWFVLIALLGGPRMAYRLFKDRSLTHLLETAGAGRIPVLVIGAGDNAEVFIRALARDRTAAYRVAGVLTGRANRVGTRIHGVEIVGLIADLAAVVARLKARGVGVQRLIITNDISGPDLAALLEVADQLALTVSRSPSVTEFKDSVAAERQIRPIAIADLLGRAQMTLDKQGVEQLITGRSVLITGAGGSIGSELVRQVAALRPARLVLLDHSEHNLYLIDGEVTARFPELGHTALLCDVRDREQVQHIFGAIKPQVVFHAAAYKHVPIVEENPLEGVLTNVIGTRNVAEAARQAGALAMIQISTDKAVNPTNVMGATKRLAEAYCQALDLAERGKGKQPTKFVTVRFGNVLGSNGSVVPLFQRQLEAGGPITVTHPEAKRYFMTIREAVELVLQAAGLGVEEQAAAGKIYILNMGEPVKIVDLAKQMIRLAGLTPGRDIQISFTGLRAGEKIFEELFHAEEQIVETTCEGLRLAAPRAANHKTMEAQLTKLEKHARARQQDKAIALLQELVPEYQASDQNQAE